MKNLTNDIELLKSNFIYSEGVLLRVVKFGKPCKPYNPCNSLNSAGYYSVRVSKNKKVGLHVAVWAYHNGRWPSNEIDHIDRNRLNNKIENLREATRSENALNTGIPKSNTSGSKNVSFHKGSGLWRVDFSGKKTKYFKDYQEAVEFVNES